MTAHGFDREQHTAGSHGLLLTQRFDAFPAAETEKEPGQSSRAPRLIFVLEDSVDVRLLEILCRISHLTLIAPLESFYGSHLNHDIRKIGLNLPVHIIPGDRLEFQWRLARLLSSHPDKYDILMSQEERGTSLISGILGKLTGKPSLLFHEIPIEDYLRRQLQQKKLQGKQEQKLFITYLKTRAVRAANRFLTSRCLAVGPYLANQFRRHSHKVTMCQSHGINTDIFFPLSPETRIQLRKELKLPLDTFLVLAASGHKMNGIANHSIFLKSLSLLVKAGTHVLAIDTSPDEISLSGVARKTGYPELTRSIIHRPLPLHGTFMKAQYLQCVDAVAQTFLEDGHNMAALEALACGTPTVLTAISGLRHHIRDFVRLVPANDNQAIARELQWIYNEQASARKKALAGSEYIRRYWSQNVAEMTLRNAINDSWPARYQNQNQNK